MAATVLQLSDTHLVADPAGRPHGRYPGRRLAAVIAAARAAGPVDLVLLTGDVTDDASVGAARRAAELIAPLGAPVLAVPGNHDRGPELEEVFGPPAPAELAGWTVVAVSSRLPGRVEGAVDPAAVLGLLDDAGARPALLALHHPPAGPSSHGWFQLGGAGELLAGLDRRPQVRLVVSGHLHQPFEVVSGGRTTLGAPSTLYALRHDGDAWEPDDTVACGARLLRLGPEGEWSSELIPLGAGVDAEVGAGRGEPGGAGQGRPGASGEGRR